MRFGRFPPSLLDDNEDLVLDLRPHWIALVKPLAQTVAILAGVVLAWLLSPFQWGGWFYALTLAGGAALFIIFPAKPITTWATSHFVVTSDRVLRRSGCSVYAVAAEKANATRALDETWLVPLIYQRITAKYLDEVEQKGDGVGSIVCDWTSYKLDHHISSCVQSYAVSRGYTQIIGGVSYGSSHSFTAIQAADLIAGAHRRWHEGASYLDPLIERLSTIQYVRPGARCVEGFPMVSVFRVF